MHISQYTIRLHQQRKRIQNVLILYLRHCFLMSSTVVSVSFSPFLVPLSILVFHSGSAVAGTCCRRSDTSCHVLIQCVVHNVISSTANDNDVMLQFTSSVLLSFALSVKPNRVETLNSVERKTGQHSLLRNIM